MRIVAHGLERTVCDYVAGMTDRYILSRYKEFFFTKILEKCLKACK
jgi:dGTP triphosphohydrolase